MFDEKYMNEVDKNCEYETYSTIENGLWKIESMHHILDITYDKDRCKLFTKRTQENINIFR